MLQQTRVETVLRYYEPFLEAFPTVQDLARAPEEAVLKAWEGLGYYRRARYLHRGAKYLCEEKDGVFPETPEELRQIPGVGEYCAGSVASLAFGVETPAVDGNVGRVLSRIHGMEKPVDQPEGHGEIVSLAAGMIPPGRVWSHNQALMELGALVCLPKTCREDICPVRAFCRAKKAGNELELPVKVKGKKPLTVRRTIYLCLDGKGRILVRQRQEGDGLLEGLWEFPGEDGTRDFPEKYGLTLPDAPTLTARHVFTHRVWEMEGFAVSWPKDRAIPEHCRWADEDDLARLPFPSAMKRFLAWANDEIG